MRWFDWLLGIESDASRRSVMQDLASGDAGPAVRGALTLCFALLAGGVSMMLYGVVESYFGIGDDLVGLAFAFAAAAWCVSLFFIWRSYGRFQRTLRALIGVVLVWVVVIPTAFVVDGAVRGGADFMIPALVMLGFGGTIWIVAMSAYQPAGRAVRRRDGEVNVRCAACGYSMVGLADCTCPECGRVYTIDELILAQDYRGDPAKPGADDEPPPVLEVEVGDQAG